MFAFTETIDGRHITVYKLLLVLLTLKQLLDRKKGVIAINAVIIVAIIGLSFIVYNFISKSDGNCLDHTCVFTQPTAKVFTNRKVSTTGKRSLRLMVTKARSRAPLTVPAPVPSPTRPNKASMKSDSKTKGKKPNDTGDNRGNTR